MAAAADALLLFTGLAVDTGRAYVVKAQLTKAVDGAALGAARSLNSGDPRGEAARIFKANFPPAISARRRRPIRPPIPDFFSSTVDAATGVNIVTVTATAVLPTTFMQLANFNTVTVAQLRAGDAAHGRPVARARRVELDRPAVGRGRATPRGRSSNSFDAAHDRLALLTFSDGAKVLDAMPSSRGFDKTKVIERRARHAARRQHGMVEGLYRGWDELRSVPAGTQSGLRVIVLFTDGASNSVPGDSGRAGRRQSAPDVRLPDRTPGDTDGQTWNNPHIAGLYDTQTGANSMAHRYDRAVTTHLEHDRSPPTLPWPSTLPVASWHTHHRSAGIPTSFPLQTTALTVNGAAAERARAGCGTRHAGGKYPARCGTSTTPRETWSRSSPTRRATTTATTRSASTRSAWASWCRCNLGTMPETSESMLKRIANDSDVARLQQRPARRQVLLRADGRRRRRRRSRASRTRFCV